ncbi:MAG TPA: NAD(P)H-dependent glycerol-3-phosphate dehydrogenase [Rhizobiaceae bacterium]|nr:NAD(P)H-dependent glycerol-3-phosphate dehydrogenase [Rhizobiaceae bacterium]
MDVLPAPRIAVLGAGAWGTALAAAQRRAGREVSLWGRDAKVIEAINERAENPAYLPGIRLPDSIAATTDAAMALTGASIVLSVVPAQVTGRTLALLDGAIAGDATVVLCAKGIEAASGRLLCAVAAEVLPGRRIAALSGPSFAADVAAGLPTAVTVANDDIDAALNLARFLSSRLLRCYASDDLAGVEAGGALKNVMAIAVGVARGLALGASAEAALATRGFAELRRIAVTAFGARPETLKGLSGLGDLMLTCSSPQSRNFAFGAALGRGEALAGRPLAEGVATAEIAAEIAGDAGIRAPITQAVAALVAGRISPTDAMTALLQRDVVAEEG